ncbi:MAG: RNA-binding protein [Comamonadaceae bacterium]|jgi:hypothetical protein|nr:RNA-binding protein [Comamonadaceae bacterium]
MYSSHSFDSRRDAPAQQLRPDVAELQDRLHGLFSEHGQVRRLDLIRADQAGRRRFLVFVRMKTAREDDAVALALGLGRFGGDLVMLISPDEDDEINPPWWMGQPGAMARPSQAEQRI